MLPKPDSAFPIVLKPYKLDISQFGEKKRTKADFTINNVSDIDLKIEIVDYQKNYLNIVLPSMVKAGKSVTGTVTINKDKLEDSFEKSLTISVKGDNERKPTRFTLPIKRAVRKLSSQLDSTMTGSGGGGS